MLGALIGSLNFLRAQIPRASLYLRALHSALTRGVNESGWSGFTTFSRATTSELLWWQRKVSLNSPYSFAPRVSQATLTSAASELGWGATLLIGTHLFETYGFFLTSDSLASSNQRETAAVLRSLHNFKPLLAAAGIHAMTVRSDNSATVCNLERRGVGLPLLHLTREIFKILTELDLRLKVVHLPGKQNELVDALSRMEISGDYSLLHPVYQRGIAALQVNPTTDLFDHRLNMKLPRFVALPGKLAGGAVALDAFSMDWTQELPYIFPPVQLVPRVLRLLLEFRTRAILVAPRWTGQAWWTTIHQASSRIVELGPSAEVLAPGPTMTCSKVAIKFPPGIFIMALIDPSPRL